MKVIKAFGVILIAWAICLYILFGPAIAYKVASTPEIVEHKDLEKYNGYIVKSLDSDWFGNWVIVRKGRDKVVLKCSDSIFAELSKEQVLGR